jgi:Zinc finger, C3HC4 type (RING finger)
VYSPNASSMHIPSSSSAMLIHHPMPTSPSRARLTSSTATINTAKRPIVLHPSRSDDTPVISNVVDPSLEPDRSTASGEEELADDSRSSSNDDDFTVSRINVSDTDLLRSESPGCLRLTEHGLKAFEMQHEGEPSPAAAIPQAFTAGRMRQSNPRRPRPGYPKAPARSQASLNSNPLGERQLSYNDGRDLTSQSSRVLAPCPEDCSTTFTPSPTSSPQHSHQRRGGSGFLSSLRGRRGADESDSSSITPLCDPDKLVSRRSTLTVSDPPPPPRRRRLFGLVGVGGGGGGDSPEETKGRKDKKKGGKNSLSSNKSTASQRYLEQVSAQEAKERQKVVEERERKRIEQKRRAYLQHQRAKEMSAKHGAATDEDEMTRPSSSRTAATVQSSLFDEDSLLLRSRSGNGSSAMRSRSAKSTAAASSRPASRRESGMLREFGEFLFAETCPATLLPEGGGSIASSTAMTSAPNTTRTNEGPDDANHQNALLPPCVVCHSAERTHVATPCFHFLYCRKCAKRLPSCVACHQPAKFRPISM